MLRVPAYVRRAARLCALTVFVLTSNCALLTKADPVVPRYFTPETPAASMESAPPASDLSLKLGRIGGGSYLKERIVYRDSDHEIGFYEDRRWTERPEIYLQRALEHALFEERGVKRDLSFSAPTLTADLIEFEEVKGATPRVRLRVAYALHDEKAVFRERSLSIERALPSGDEATQTARVAAELGAALRDVAKKIADEVVADMASRADRSGG